MLSSKSISNSVISPSKGGVAGGVCGECSGVRGEELAVVVVVEGAARLLPLRVGDEDVAEREEEEAVGEGVGRGFLGRVETAPGKTNSCTG